MRIFIPVVMLVAVSAVFASAGTYRFTEGDVTDHVNRCASPSAVKRVRDLVTRSQLTLGHDQATLTIVQDPPIILGADEVAGSYSRYVLTPQLTIIVRFDALTCTDSHCRGFRATVSIIQRYDGATCYEQWSGAMEVLK